MEIDQSPAMPDRERQDRDRLAIFEAVCIGFENHRLVADLCYDANSVEEAAVSIAAALDLSPQQAKAVLDQQVRGLNRANRARVREERDELRQRLS